MRIAMASIILFVSFLYSGQSLAQTKVVRNQPANDSKSAVQQKSVPAADKRLNQYVQQSMSFLMNPSYQKELELSDEQKSVFKSINQNLRDGYQAIYAKKKPELDNAKQDYKKRSAIYRELQDEYTNLRTGLESQAIDQLVPNQKSILTQIKFRYAVRAFGMSATLGSSFFTKQFQLTDKQKLELEKIKKETEEEIIRLSEEKRQQGKEKMLRLLNPEQRKIFRNLDGDEKAKTRIRL